MFFIYRIFKEGDENAYIGSTNDFVKRRNKHKHNCCNLNRKEHNLKIYQHIREHGGWDTWHMEIFEESESRDREIELIKLNKPTLNTLYYNFDKKEYDKKISRKNYKKYDCECGGKYANHHKARHFRSIMHQKYLSSDTHDSVS